MTEGSPQSSTLPSPTWPIPQVPQHTRSMAPWFKLHDHDGEMTIRLAWTSLLLPVAFSTITVFTLLAIFWQVPLIRIASLFAVGIAAGPVAILSLVASIPFLATAMNHSPLLELRSADAVLRWHKNSHTLPLRDVAAFEIFWGDFSTNTPTSFAAYSAVYSQWQVRTATGERHVLWHARSKGRANIAVLREFALAAGVPVEEYEANIREDKAKPEGRQVRITGLRRIS